MYLTCHSLFSAVLRRCGGADRQKVGTAIGKWLSGSRDRDGKRLLRLKEKGSAAGPPAADGAVQAEPAMPATVPAPAEGVVELPPPQDEARDEGEDPVAMAIAAGLGLAPPPEQEGEELPREFY